jgi:hypothetical protein
MSKYDVIKGKAIIDGINISIENLRFNSPSPLC